MQLTARPVLYCWTFYISGALLPVLLALLYLSNFDGFGRTTRILSALAYPLAFACNLVMVRQLLRDVVQHVQHVWQRLHGGVRCCS